MNTAYKHTLTVLVVACLATLCIMVAGTCYSHAAINFEAQDDGVNSYTPESGIVLNNAEWFYVYPPDNGPGIDDVKVTSGDPECIQLGWQESSYRTGSKGYIGLYGLKPGSCVLTITDDYGGSDNEVTIPVTVTDKIIELRLKNSFFYDYYYGLRELELITMNGAEATIKVGSDVYEPVSRREEYDHDAITFKLNKVYKIGTKIVPTVTYGGITAQGKTHKIKSQTSTWGYKSTKKKPKVLKVEVRNLHKGDVVKVKYKGKTYKSAKYTKDTDYQTWKWVSVKLKKKMTASAKFKVWVVNKYGQKLTLPSTIQLDHWEYEVPW